MQFEYVEGHSNEEGNEEADRLANEGIQKKRTIPIAYAGGACIVSAHGEPIGGVGVYWGPNNPSNVAESFTGVQTKERAKIQAINAALKSVSTFPLRHYALVARSNCRLFR